MGLTKNDLQSPATSILPYPPLPLILKQAVVCRILLWLYSRSGRMRGEHETGQITLLRVMARMMGKAINPKLIEGQG